MASGSPRPEGAANHELKAQEARELEYLQVLLKNQRIALIATLIRFCYEITQEIQGRLAQEDRMAHNKGTCDLPIRSNEELSQSKSYDQFIFWLS